MSTTYQQRENREFARALRAELATMPLGTAQTQARMVRFVGQHGGNFATPAPNGAVYIYSLCSGPAAGCLIRDIAYSPADCRNILGY